ncbi:MAG: flavin reductase [Anaerolineae bacterium]|nr:MAG: flavin reductase [Anaerolineae bacterium]
MKHEISVEKPSYLKEAWPGKYRLFSWLEYAMNIPYPIFIVTTLKENGRSNACLHSWGCFGGGGGGYYSIFTMLKSYHTYANILRSGEWCINFPLADQRDQCMKTIENNGPENDEILDSGFTIEPSQVIQAPRISECPINLECRLAWERPLFDGSEWHVFAGRAVHLAMDDATFELDPQQRMQTLRTMYNLRSTLNPLTGETGPSSLPVIGVPEAI